MHLVTAGRKRTASLLVVTLIALLIPIMTASPALAATAGDIVITEIMKNPASVADTSGEWFEVYNPTSSDINLVNWQVSDGGTEGFTIDGTVMVPAGGYAVLGNNDDAATNGGVTVNFTYDGTTFFLDDAEDELILRGPASEQSPEIDRVEWDSVTFPNPDGASMSLDPDFTNVTDNDDGANWCPATSMLSGTDYGTPGAANDECVAPPTTPPPPPPPPAELVISEVMQHPASVSDGNGEWFEIYNPTSSPVDINGWTIADGGTDSHVIDNGGPLNVPAGGYIVLGNNADTTLNGGVTLDYAFSGITLDNGADELILFDVSMVESDRVEWDGGAAWPNPQGASMILDDLTADNNDGSNWCVASSAYGVGDLGTPGAVNDSCTPAPPAPKPHKVTKRHHESHHSRFHVPKPKPKQKPWRQWHRSHHRCLTF